MSYLQPCGVGCQGSQRKGKVPQSISYQTLDGMGCQAVLGRTILWL